MKVTLKLSKRYLYIQEIIPTYSRELMLDPDLDKQGSQEIQEEWERL